MIMMQLIKYIKNNILYQQATIGVDFATKNIEYKENSLKLQIWDSAGQERYKALIPSYVRGASIIFILYDVSNKNSFSNVKTWINFIKEVNTDDSFLVLCGNKIDLPRQVTTNEGKILAEKEKTLFFEVSAKSGAGVDNMMYNCIAKLSFFQEFKVENEEKLIKDLIESNSKGGNDAKMNNADMAKNFVVQADENASNFRLNNPINNKNEEIKKKCGC